MGGPWWVGGPPHWPDSCSIFPGGPFPRSDPPAPIFQSGTSMLHSLMSHLFVVAPAPSSSNHSVCVFGRILMAIPTLVLFLAHVSAPPHDHPNFGFILSSCFRV